MTSHDAEFIIFLLIIITFTQLLCGVYAVGFLFEIRNRLNDIIDASTPRTPSS